LLSLETCSSPETIAADLAKLHPEDTVLNAVSVLLIRSSHY